MTWDWILYLYLLAGIPIHALVLYVLNRFGINNIDKHEGMRFFYCWYLVGFLIGVTIWPLTITGLAVLFFVCGGKDEGGDSHD